MQVKLQPENNNEPGKEHPYLWLIWVSTGQPNAATSMALPDPKTPLLDDESGHLGWD